MTDRDPVLLALLAELEPAARERLVWADGTMPLEVSAYLTTQTPPDSLVTSVRCIVSAHDRIVVCQAPDGRHIVPGGRREPGETIRQTAVREVREETGWYVDPDALTLLGFLHLRHLNRQPADFPYPTPDFTQLIFTGNAVGRAVAADDPWTDSEGWEQSSALHTPAEVLELGLPVTQIPFLQAIIAS